MASDNVKHGLLATGYTLAAAFGLAGAVYLYNGFDFHTYPENDPYWCGYEAGPGHYGIPVMVNHLKARGDKNFCKQWEPAALKPVEP